MQLASRKLEIPSKNFGIEMMMKTCFCFHRLENNLSSRLLSRALSQAPSMVRKCVVFHYLMVTIYEINVP